MSRDSHGLISDLPARSQEEHGDEAIAQRVSQALAEQLRKRSKEKIEKKGINKASHSSY